MQAVASSFTSSVIQARSTCDPPLCFATAVAVTEVVKNILAEAAAEVLFAQCATMGDTFDTTVLSEQIVTATATSLAAVYAQTSVIGGVCDLSVSALSKVTF